MINGQKNDESVIFEKESLEVEQLRVGGREGGKGGGGAGISRKWSCHRDSRLWGGQRRYCAPAVQ